MHEFSPIKSKKIEILTNTRFVIRNHVTDQDREIMSQKSQLQLIFSRPMLVCFVMGFACGLPLLLTMSLLQAWLKEAGLDLGAIGLMTLVQLPYTVKFLWAPFLDRYILPILGRRRGWMLVFQVALMLAIIGLGQSDPHQSLTALAIMALAVAFFSASQDIVVDAYRREDLTNHELPAGTSLYIAGYRIGMVVASGGGLILADHLPFSQVYLVMAACMIPGILTTLLTPEPAVTAGAPKSLVDAVIEPFLDYFRRPEALWILLFILLYKIGDAMAGAMTMPFYLTVGFTKSTIGVVVKFFGLWMTIGGGLIGGVIMYNLGIYRSLWIFGVLQGLSTACFALLTQTGAQIWALSGVIAFENLTSGLGTAAYTAFMASITNKKFTATQYALLSSLMGVPRVIAAAPTGFMAEHLGWPVFFIGCAFAAIPGLLILQRFKNWSTAD